MSSYEQGQPPKLYAISGGRQIESDEDVSSARTGRRLALTSVRDNVYYVGRVIPEGQTLGVRTKNITQHMLAYFGVQGQDLDEAWNRLQRVSALSDSADQRPFMYAVSDGQPPRPVQHHDIGRIPEDRILLLVDSLCHNIFDAPNHDRFEDRLGRLGPAVMAFAALSEEIGPRPVYREDSGDLLQQLSS